MVATLVVFVVDSLTDFAGDFDADVKRRQHVAPGSIIALRIREQGRHHRRRRMHTAGMEGVVVIVRVHGAAVGERGESRRRARGCTEHRCTTVRATQLANMPLNDFTALGFRAGQRDTQRVEYRLLAARNDRGGDIAVARVVDECRDVCGQRSCLIWGIHIYLFVFK